MKVIQWQVNPGIFSFRARRRGAPWDFLIYSMRGGGGGGAPWDFLPQSMVRGTMGFSPPEHEEGTPWDCLPQSTKKGHPWIFSPRAQRRDTLGFSPPEHEEGAPWDFLPHSTEKGHMRILFNSLCYRNNQSKNWQMYDWNPYIVRIFVFTALIHCTLCRDCSHTFIHLSVVRQLLLPAHASEQGNVISFIWIYIICVQNLFAIQRTRDLIYIKL